MPKALILGVDGQDGSYLVEFLLEKGYSVIGWIPAGIKVSLDHIQHVQDKITLVEGDLKNQESLAYCLMEHQPEEIYNLAAPSSPVESWNLVIENGDVIALGVARLLEAVRLNIPQARLYQASSSEIFGSPAEVPQSETTPYRPRNPYGIAKLYAHWLVVRYREHFNLFSVSGILFNHESPRRHPQFVTRKISRRVAEIYLGLAQELRLGNLEAKRDWGFAKDYVRAMWMMLQNSKPVDYVIGTGEVHSVREFCELAFSSLGMNYRDYVIQDPELFRPSEETQLIANPVKARLELKWSPEVKFEDLVNMMVQADIKAISIQ